MRHSNKRKFLITSLILGIVVFSAYSFRPPEQPKHKDNLKILSKDISHKDLMAIMHSYESALGYKCGDCHAKAASGDRLDFASYANPKKKVALQMMKMVEKINKKNFGIKGKFADNYLHNTYMVTCYTCHHGNSQPEIVAPSEEMGK